MPHEWVIWEFCFENSDEGEAGLEWVGQVKVCWGESEQSSFSELEVAVSWQTVAGKLAKMCAHGAVESLRYQWTCFRLYPMVSCEQ